MRLRWRHASPSPFSFAPMCNAIGSSFFFTFAFTFGCPTVPNLHSLNTHPSLTQSKTIAARTPTHGAVLQELRSASLSGRTRKGNIIARWMISRTYSQEQNQRWQRSTASEIQNLWKISGSWFVVHSQRLRCLWSARGRRQEKKWAWTKRRSLILHFSFPTLPTPNPHSLPVDLLGGVCWSVDVPQTFSHENSNNPKSIL